MKTVEKKISDLKAAEYNPKQLSEKQYKDLRTSIEKFGLKKPLIINLNPDRKNVVIDGHQRLKVAKDLGFKKIYCVGFNLSEEEERELNLRLEKNTGEIDFEKLADHFDVDELIGVGFEEWELGITDEDEDLLTLSEEEEQQESDQKNYSRSKEGLVTFDCLMRKEDKKKLLGILDVVKHKEELDTADQALRFIANYYDEHSES